MGWLRCVDVEAEVWIGKGRVSFGFVEERVSAALYGERGVAGFRNFRRGVEDVRYVCYENVTSVSSNAAFSLFF